MKLLLDQNISHKLLHDLTSFFPDSNHVRLLSLEHESDHVIWDYARKHDFVIVTQDSDFYDRSVVYGHPPKIIWIKSGNVGTSYIRNLLVRKAGLIEEFTKDPELACLELY